MLLTTHNREQAAGADFSRFATLALSYFIVILLKSNHPDDTSLLDFAAMLNNHKLRCIFSQYTGCAGIIWFPHPPISDNLKTFGSALSILRASSVIRARSRKEYHFPISFPDFQFASGAKQDQMRSDSFPSSQSAESTVTRLSAAFHPCQRMSCGGKKCTARPFSTLDVFLRRLKETEKRSESC